MNHRRIVIRLLLLALVLLPVHPVQAATLAPAAATASVPSAAPQKVLLLFDSLAKGTAREGNVTVLQQLLATYNASVTLVNLDQYEQGTMASYSRVITVINAEDLTVTNKAYLTDAERYKGQLMHIGYKPPVRLKQALRLTAGMMYGGSADLRIGEFSGSLQLQDNVPYIASAGAAVQSYGSLSLQDGGLQVPYAVSGGSYTYVPYLQEGNASVLGMAYVLQDWLKITAPPRTYLVIKEIYPFSDLNLLETAADELYRNGIPFIVSVRPVFSNTDFPAMQRYLEALRVVQSQGGSILVNAPVVMPSISSSDHTLGEKMSTFINLLVSNGIAPLGIGTESYWAYDKEYAAAGMDFFDSAVLYPDEKVMHMEPTNVSKAFSSSLYSMPLEFLQNLHTTGRAMPDFPFNAAVTVDLPADNNGLNELLQRLDSYWISFADYKQEEHQVVTDVNTISSTRGSLSVNGQSLNIDYVPETVSSDYQYREEQQQSFTRLFNVQNQFFIVVIILSLLLFGGLLIIGYRMYKKKYLK